MQTRPNPKVIRFDTKDDIKLRFRASHSHDLAKQLRDAGLRFIRVCPIERDIALSTKLHISKKSKAQQIVVGLTGVSYQDKSIIDDFLSYFLTSNDYLITSHGNYDTNTRNPSYYFVVEPTKQSTNEKEIKSDLLE